MKNRIYACLVVSMCLLMLLASCSKNSESRVGEGAPRLYPIKEKGKWGYMDLEGKIVVAPSYDYTWNFEDGMGRFKEKGKYGFVNEKGEIVIKPAFAFADNFKDGFARVNTKDTT